ncbi:MAG: FHA domain-containing protein [Anaerolineae bacterium]|nr:FHA domain-containing protein [Anaerolineae bacterium]MDQ7036067.1 FHA domain-containing protein [Anaerolineae bacterium]
MSKDDGFQRRKWGTNASTDVPLAPEEEEDLLKTTVWHPAPDVLVQQPLLWLIVLEPIESRGVVIAVKSGAVIGRQGDIRWNDPHMSRQHAQFMLVQNPAQSGNQAFAIAPFNDRNGTYVNGNRIHHVTLLQENDRVEMGNTLFIIKVVG